MISSMELFVLTFLITSLCRGAPTIAPSMRPTMVPGLTPVLTPSRVPSNAPSETDSETSPAPHIISRDDKEEFLSTSRDYYQTSYPSTVPTIAPGDRPTTAPSQSPSSIHHSSSNYGYNELLSQHNMEATGGRKKYYSSHEELGFVLLDWGPIEFEKTCIAYIISNRLKVVSAIGDMHHRNYAVKIVLENLTNEKIECIMDKGTVFEQKTWVQAQNLALTDKIEVKIGANEGTKVYKETLEAFCIDPSYRSPHGEAMNITPFLFKPIKEHGDKMNQGGVWDEVRKVRTDVTESLKVKQEL